MFSWRCSIHEMAPFGGVSGPFLPQIWLQFAEISTRGSLSLNNLSKLSVYAETGRTQSRWIWFIFGPNLLLEKPKYCQKNKVFSETTSL